MKKRTVHQVGYLQGSHNTTYVFLKILM